MPKRNKCESDGQHDSSKITRKTATIQTMKAYRGVVKDGVIVLEGSKLPEGTVVTVTVSNGELVRATITSAFAPRRKTQKIRLRPTPTT